MPNLPQNREDESSRGGELHLPPEAQSATARALAQFLQAHPRMYHRPASEWRDECAQEAFLAAYEALQTYCPERGDLEGYVYCAVQNHLTSVYYGERRWYRWHAVSLDAPVVDEEGEVQLREVVDEGSVGLEAELLGQLALGEALARLSELERYLVEAVWVAGRSQEEVAVELREQGLNGVRYELSQQAISKRLKKIKSFLREQLGGDLG